MTDNSREFPCPKRPPANKKVKLIYERGLEDAFKDNYAAVLTTHSRRDINQILPAY
jgi:hypothetical protein